MLGAVIGQIVGGQIGGRSIALSQSGCMLPFTHWQVHPAQADAALTSKMVAATSAHFISRPSWYA
jgi:hypothetical protein